MADAISTGLLSELSAREKYAPANTEKQELGQDVFLELMVTQMRNQNPLDPQDNSEFVAQLAQFSSVEGLDKLNNTMEGFVGSFQSNQALQASALVGRSVKVDSDTSYLAADGRVAGTIELPQELRKSKWALSLREVCRFPGMVATVKGGSFHRVIIVLRCWQKLMAAKRKLAPH